VADARIGCWAITDGNCGFFNGPRSLYASACG
jgi:hypothetical protein